MRCILKQKTRENDVAQKLLACSKQSLTGSKSLTVICQKKKNNEKLTAGGNFASIVTSSMAAKETKACVRVDLRYRDPEDRIFNRVISDIFVVLRETAVTFSDSIETGSPAESEIVRVVSHSTTDNRDKTIWKKKKTIFRV